MSILRDVFAAFGVFCFLCIAVGFVRQFPDWLREQRIIGRGRSRH
jgi:hypothetical protein